MRPILPGFCAPIAPMPDCVYSVVRVQTESEKSRTSFARFKGMAENQIFETGLDFYSFRPAYIYPVTPRKEPNFMYTISRWLYPDLKVLRPNASVKSTEMAQAMFNVGLKGGAKKILENRDILESV